MTRIASKTDVTASPSQTNFSVSSETPLLGRAHRERRFSKETIETMAVGSLYFTTTLARMSFDVRLPALKRSLHASDHVLSGLLAANAAGELLSMAGVDWCQRTVGTRKTAIAPLLAFNALLASAGFLTDTKAAAAVYAAMGFTNGLAATTHITLGMDLDSERRPVMGRLFAVSSVGALVGAGVGSLLAQQDAAVSTHLSAVAVSCSLLAASAYFFLQ